jgi:PAS domain S-box-containing protein
MESKECITAPGAVAHKFDRLAESGILGVVEWDFDGNIVDANRTFLDLVGCTEADLKAGKLRYLEMTPEESMPVSLDALRQLEAEGYCRPFEKEFFHKDGSRISVVFGAAVLPGTRGGLGFMIDRTENWRGGSPMNSTTC